MKTLQMYKKTAITYLASYIAVFAIVIMSFSGLNSRANVLPEIWNGDKSLAVFERGTGTPNDPFLISNGSELYLMVSKHKTTGTASSSAYVSDPGTMYFKLTNDIYLNDPYNYLNWGTTAPANSWYNFDNYFKGHLDGRGYTIYGLYCSVTGYGGLFQQLTSGGSISNLNLKKSYVRGTSYTGGIIGRSAKLDTGDTPVEVNITRCSVTDTTIVSGNTNGAGGIAGVLQLHTKIEASYFADGTLTCATDNRNGGIFADGWGATITVNNCFSAGYYPIGRNNNNSFAFSNVYSDYDKNQLNGTNTNVTTITLAEMKGANALTKMSLSSSVWYATASYPALKVLDTPGYTVWNGDKTLTSFANGAGTENNPYLITNGSELYLMIKMYKTSGTAYADVDPGAKYFKLNNDIYLNDISYYQNWATTAPANSWYDFTNSFKGHLDGRGYTICGLYCNVTGESGLVQNLCDGGSIKNLNLTKSYIKGTAYAGGICGRTEKFITELRVDISRCSVTNATIIAGNSNAAGGIAGKLQLTCQVENSYFADGSLTSGMTGGISGDGWASWMKFSKCYSAGYYPMGRGTFANGFTAVDTYTDQSKNSLNGSHAEITQITLAEMKGANALTKMNLSSDVWFATNYYPELKPIGALEDSGIWNGDKTKILTEGDGTQLNPYKITNGAELYAVVRMYKTTGSVYDNDPGVLYFEILNDIYLNDTASYASWGTSPPANGWITTDSYFKGHLNGGSFTIFGLYSDNSSGFAGLFPSLTEGGSITDLNLKNSYVKGTSYSGGIIGRSVKMSSSDQLKIARCSVKESTIIGGNDHGAGGIAGALLFNTLIEDCYFADGSLTSLPDRNGGIFADSWGSTLTIIVKNSFSAGHYPVGRAGNNSFTFSNVYSNCDKNQLDGTNSNVTTIALAEMKGASALTNMNLSENVWLATDSYPVLKTGGGVAEPFWTVPASNDVAGITYDSGSGTIRDPFIITTADQLYKMVYEHGKSSSEVKQYYNLGNDIYLNDVENQEISAIPTASRAGWFVNSTANAPATAFIGTLDGRGYTVYGLSDSPSSRTGLIPVAGNGASVKNLNIRKAALLAAQTYSAPIIAWVNTGASVTVSGCTVRNVEVKSKFVGGIIGAATGTSTTISDCAFQGGTLTTTNTNETENISNGCVGGIINDGWGGFITVKDSYSVGYYPVPKTGNTHRTDFFSYNRVYTDTASIFTDGTLSSISQINNSSMKGNSSALSMNFNWNEIWSVVANDYPMPRVIDEFNEGTEGAVWSGKLALEFAGGDGTKDNPYQIKTGEQLYKMVSEHCLTVDPEPGAYYTILADIKLNDTTGDWTNNTNVKSWFSTSTAGGFNGHVEGNGHFITGLYTKGISGKAGLIPIIAGSTTIKNIHVRDSYLSSTNNNNGYIGGIAGYLQVGSSALIGGCSVRDTYFGDAAAAGGIVGGISTGSLYIDSCYFVGSFSGSNNYAGGIYGDSWGTPVVTDCYSAGAVMFDKSGSLANSNRYSTVSQEDSENAKTLTVTVLTDSQMKGTAAKNNMSGLDWDGMWYTVANDYPHLNLFTSTNGVAGAVWTGKKATDFAGGNGTQADPYQIETGEQLYKMVLDQSVASVVKKWFIVTQDIRLNDVTSEKWATKTKLNSWFVSTSINVGFNGHLDGKGHVVSGLFISSEGDKGRGALIPVIDKGSVIENIGVTQSYIDMSVMSEETYGAAIVGYVRDWDSNEVTLNESDFPFVSNCFADSTVTIRGLYAGGIVSGVPAPIKVENCYFTGTLEYGSTSFGGIIGNVWSPGSIIRSCFVSTTGLDPFSGGQVVRSSTGDITIENSYVFGGGSRTGVEFIIISDTYGDKAKTIMSKLDFQNIWQTVEKGTPVLRVFGANAVKYSDKNPRNSTITFVTNTDTITVPSMTGSAGAEVILPKPSRVGYVFSGWYVYQELQWEYTQKRYPLTNLTLYAKWTPNSLIQGFEDYPNTEYDLGSDYEYYRPGVTDYSAEMVHNGSKAIHRIGKTNDEQDFLLNYEDELTVGIKYVMTFWMMSDTSGASGIISLVHATWPDIDEPNLGIEKITSFKSLTKGKWTQYTFEFTALTKWVSIRTTGGASLFLDDFMLIATGTGEITSRPGSNNLEEGDDEPSPKTGDNASVMILLSVLAASAVLLMISAKGKIKAK